MPNITSCSDLYYTDMSGAKHTLQRLYYGSTLVWEKNDSYDITINITKSLTVCLGGFWSDDYKDIVATVDWGDGIVEKNKKVYNYSYTDMPNHIYQKKGIYTIKIQAININQFGGLFDEDNSDKDIYTMIENISFPKSITYIGISSFNKLLTNLKTITFKSPNKLNKIDMLNIIKSKVSIELPVSVVEINPSAFAETLITAITFSDNLEKIGSSSFNMCSELLSVSIPLKVKAISDNAFYGCTKLKEVTFQEGLQSIEDSAFNRCSSLESLNFPLSLTTLGNYCFFGGRSVKNITFNPNSKIANIPYECFAECRSLENLILPNDITDIKSYAFYQCTQLKNLILPNTLKTIGDYAFYGEYTEDSGEYKTYYNTDCTQIIFPNTLQSLGGYAFQGFKGITNLIIPSSVTSIGVDCFYRCENLKTITINKPRDSISGSPWGATLAEINWIG